MNKDLEDDDASTDRESSTVEDEDSESSSSDDEDVNVAFLLADKDFEEADMVATTVSETQGDYEGPYEVIEGLLEVKID